MTLKELVDKWHGKIISKPLSKIGFVRSDDRSDEESLRNILDRTIFDKECSIDEVYIARGELYSSDKPYVIFFRGPERRNRKYE